MPGLDRRQQPSLLKVNKDKEWKLNNVREAVSKVLDSYQKDKDMLIQILLDLQTEFGWLPQEVLAEVSKQLEVPITQVYQIASYYKAFSLYPKGRHTVTVCLGTACQVRGAPILLDRISTMLNLKPGETAADMHFSLETVNCLGCCALGPVVVLDGVYYARPSFSDLEKVFESAK
jgi:NADH-quinone oxidoreductase subunit E